MKKAILLLVEGPSDEDALGDPTSSLIRNVLVDSSCFHTDVTTASLFPKNASFEVDKDVVKTVQKFVDAYIGKNPGYGWSDLAAVIHVVDLDGALVGPHAVVENRELSSVRYGESAIESGNRDFILRRNKVKRAALVRLAKQAELGKGRRKVPYRVFFMSRNLEHALYGIADELSSADKIRLSSAFAKACAESPALFLGALRDRSVAVSGSYDETWSWAFAGTHSLERGSNYHLLFDEIADIVAKA